jgi:lipopolysaccharide heptosyltransferase II
MPERVLIIQPYGIGDAIFMFPLLQAIEKKLRPERIDVILGSRTRSLFENLSYVDDIFVVDKDAWRSSSRWRVLCDKVRLLKTLHHRRYTLYIDVSMQPEYAFWARFFLRIPTRAGFDYKRRNPFLNRTLHIPPGGFQGKNVGAWYADLGSLIGLKVDDEQPRWPLSPEQEASGSALLVAAGLKQGVRYIVVVPGGGGQWGKNAYAKRWPVEAFIELLRLMKADGCTDTVVVLGSGDEKPLAKILKNGSLLPVIDLCGATDLVQAGAVIKGARLFIGNDGGLTHLASAQNVPIVAIYGPVDPVVYGPYPSRPRSITISHNLDCQPCYRGFRYKSDCRDIKCLSALIPQEVHARLRNWLATL